MKDNYADSVRNIDSRNLQHPDTGVLQVAMKVNGGWQFADGVIVQN